MCSAYPRLARLAFTSRCTPSPSARASRSPAAASLRPAQLVKPPEIGRRSRSWRRPPLPVATLHDDSLGAPTLFEEGDSSYVLASSEGEESDTDLLMNPTADVDLPTTASRDRAAESPDQALTVTAHRFATLQKGHRRKRIWTGVLINTGLMVFLGSFILFVDWWSWRIVRLPLEPFYLAHPFSISVALSAFAGCLYIPIVDSMKLHQILRKEGPITHSSKRGIPTMGGLFFIPIGVTVARGIAGDHSLHVCGAAVVTLAFALVGFLDDILSYIKNHNYGLPGWIKFILQVVLGTWFSFWLDSADIPTPYSMKFLVPFPPPIGLLYLGKLYFILTTFCFVSMANGVNLTDGLDGLAGGTSALAFIGMAVAVLPLCPELAVFGASMAGACVGFLFHNRYRASVFMGDTGSLALGGALAAMAASTGMFLPLFISSGVFVLEVLSVIVQVFYKKVTRRMYGTARRIFRMAPVHHHFELCGVKEPVIVASCYVISCILACYAGYVGFISA